MTAAADALEMAKIDFDNPPVLAPAECVDPVMWAIAGYLHRNHSAGANGECARCSGAFPCLGRTLAQTGLRTAMGEENTESNYWRGYARIQGPVK